MPSLIRESPHYSLAGLHQGVSSAAHLPISSVLLWLAGKEGTTSWETAGVVPAIYLDNKRKVQFSTEGSRGSCFWATWPGETREETLNTCQFPGPWVLSLAKHKACVRKCVLHTDLSLLFKYLLNLQIVAKMVQLFTHWGLLKWF